MNRPFPAFALLIIMLLAAAGAGAQGNDDQRLIRRRAGSGKTRKATSCPRAYIGFSGGINNPAGYIGPQLDIAVSPVVSVGTGFGLSTWGNKAFLEARYYFKPCNRGWAIGSGFTYNTGARNVALPGVETIYGDRDIIISQHSQLNFMISACYFFNLGRQARHRFHLQAGYSVPLKAVSFDSDLTLTANGHDQVALFAPGGLIIGVGFSFGTGRM